MPTRLRPRHLAALLSLALASPALAQTSGPTIESKERQARPERVAADWLQRRWAQADLERLASAVEARVRDAGPLPAGAGWSTLAPDYLPAREPLDPWGTAYRLVGGPNPAVLSAGSDREFGSADDLSRTLALPPGSVPAREGDAELAVAAPAPPATAPAPAAKPAVAASRAAEQAAPPAPRETAAHRSTRERMREIAKALEGFRAREGHFPQHDDATRLLRLLGVEGGAEDAWGNRFAYLSLAGGSRCVLVSPGPDGRLGQSLEGYLRGASPAGDLVFLNAKEL